MLVIFSSLLGLATACQQTAPVPTIIVPPVKLTPPVVVQHSAPTVTMPIRSSSRARPPTITVAPPTATGLPATPLVTTANGPLLPFKPLEKRAIMDRVPPHMRALTDGKHKYKNVRWGPSGNWMAATPQDGPGLDLIQSASGHVVHVLTDTFALEPVWDVAAPACTNGGSQAGSLLVQQLVAKRDLLRRFSVCTMSFEAAPVVVSDQPIRAAALAGDSVAYSVGQQLMVQVGVAGTPTPILHEGALVMVLSPGSHSSLAWTPLVDNLEMVSTVTMRPPDMQVRPLSTPGEGWWLPQWSVDGTRLALSNIDGRIGTVQPVTGRRYDLGPGETPAWSPDGQTIAFAGSSAGEAYTTRDIYLVDWQGHGPRLRLTHANAEQLFVSPTWSPDGRELAFVEIDSGKIFIAERP